MVVIETVSYDQQVTGSLDVVVGQLAMFVEGRIIPSPILVETGRNDQPFGIQI